eukprot:4735382-Pleurochrysis_carterae.AAC.3
MESIKDFYLNRKASALDAWNGGEGRNTHSCIGKVPRARRLLPCMRSGTHSGSEPPDGVCTVQTRRCVTSARACVWTAAADSQVGLHTNSMPMLTEKELQGSRLARSIIEAAEEWEWSGRGPFRFGASGAFEASWARGEWGERGHSLALALRPSYCLIFCARARVFAEFCPRFFNAYGISPALCFRYVCKCRILSRAPFRRSGGRTRCTSEWRAKSTF